MRPAALAGDALPEGGADGAATLADSGAAEPRTGRAAAPSPRAVTRGESTAGGQTVKVDWLNATFPGTDASIGGILALLRHSMNRPVSADPGRGLLGFEESWKLYAHVGSRRVHAGAVARGGEAQGGRWLLQLTGTGCGFVLDWQAIHDALEGLDARITRVDLALDFLAGEYTVDNAVSAYEGGGFGAGGRMPDSSVAGDWIKRQKGRTFYVGKAKNGKLLRVYEKGLQLGAAQSDWVRVEVQLGNRDRVIPFSVLLNPATYFAGCYPALADMVDVAATAVPTLRASGLVALSHLVRHLRRSYGKVMDVLVHDLQCDPVTLVEQCRVIGIPRRVNPSSCGAGVDPDDVFIRAKE